MKEEWLFPEAVVPVDAETTAALVAEIHRLIDVVGGMALAQPDAFEQGRQEGMKQERALWELSKLGQEIEAQPEQEPVAWITEWEGQYSSGKILDYIAHTRGGKVEYTPLYTTPPQRTWVGLTEKDICEAAVKSQDGISPRNDTLRFAIAIEAKLKEKNT